MRFEVVDAPKGQYDAAFLAHETLRALQAVVVLHFRGVGKPEGHLRFWESLIREVGEIVVTGEDSETGLRTATSIWEDVRFDPRYRNSFRHHNSSAGT
jgi:hypothetical protein